MGKPLGAAFVRLLRGVLGLKRRLEVDGVRYKELNTTPLDRAISPRGRGRKRYEVRFPAGRPMTISVTPRRRYADLMDVPELRSIRHAKDLVRPGSRVLILGSGTGGLARVVAGWVGPHGGIVAIDPDNESVRFARRRYRLESTSFERGSMELLGGELDGSFDVVVVVEARVEMVEHRRAVCAEAWRVTGAGGSLIVVGDSEGDLLGACLRLDDSRSRSRCVQPSDGGPSLLVVSKPDIRREARPLTDDGGYRGDGGSGR